MVYRRASAVNNEYMFSSHTLFDFDVDLAVSKSSNIATTEFDPQQSADFVSERSIRVTSKNF